MRFAKTTKKQQEVVEIANVHTLKKKSVLTDQSKQESSEEISSNITSSDQSLETTAIKDASDPSLFNGEIPSIYTNPEDSVVISRQEAEEIKEEAKWAEDRGRWSFTLSILTPLLFFAGAILLLVSTLGGASTAGVILSLALLALTLVSIILSFVFGAQSLNAQYNTPKGRKKAIAGIIISSIFLALFLFNIALGL